LEIRKHTTEKLIFVVAEYFTAQASCSNLWERCRMDQNVFQLKYLPKKVNKDNHTTPLMKEKYWDICCWNEKYCCWKDLLLKREILLLKEKYWDICCWREM